MIPEKAYIIRISSSLSIEYAKTAAESCERLGISFEFFDGIEGKTSYEAWTNTGLEIKPGSMDHKKNNRSIDAAACCSVSHALVWKKIFERRECAIIFEHDALMLHNIDLEIPDNKIVALGYKLSDYRRYNHVKAGPPKSIFDINQHSGAHAYVITWKTAEILLNELKEKGGGGPVDNRYFMVERYTKVPLAIMDPTPAIGWVRKSTLWENAVETTNLYDVGILSFTTNLKRS